LILSVSAAAVPEPHRTDKSDRDLPDFKLTAVTVDQTRALQKKDMLGKVWIADFMFTRCTGSCPLNSARMEGLQKRLPKDILLASFTVDPKNDQAKALREYAGKYHARPGRWMFLTAPDEESLIPLFKDTFHTAYRPNAKAPCGYETFHSVKFFLIDRRGAIQGEYTSNDPEQLARLETEAVKLAKGENE
jgi:cytochrome oxidase Cu insertion factor (SCO1/SenC/PrrC family)